MPRQARQASQALAEAVGAGALAPATGRCVFALTVPAAVAGTIDYTWAGIAGLSFRVLQAWLVKTVAGEAAVATTIQLRTAAGAAISDAMSLNGVADTAIVRSGTIDDAAYTVAAGGGLQVRQVTAGGTTDSSCIVYVEVAILSASSGKAFQASAALTATAPGALNQPTMLAVLALPVPDMATGNVDYAGLTGFAFKVLDAFFLKRGGGVGVAVDTIQVQTAAGAAISDAVSINGLVDQGIARAASINPANNAIAAGVGLRVAVVKAGGNTEGVIYALVALTTASATKKTSQSSARLAQTLAAAGLSAPSLELVFPCVIVQAAGNNDFSGIPGMAFRIVDLVYLKTNAAAGAAATLQLQTAGGVPVTDALNINVASGTLVRAAQIDDATHAFAAGAGFRLASVGGGADCRGTALVRVALV